MSIGCSDVKNLFNDISCDCYVNSEEICTNYH